MVRLTCLLRRKAGLTPAEFHEHWRTVHGPLIAASQSAGSPGAAATKCSPLRDLFTGRDFSPRLAVSLAALPFAAFVSAV